MTSTDTPSASTEPAVNENTLTDRIDALCHSLGVSRRGLARRVGIIESHLTVIMRRGVASTETLIRIYQATGCSLAWLRDGTGGMFDDRDPDGIQTSLVSAVNYARATGLPAEVVAGIATEAAQGTGPADLLARMQVGAELARLTRESPATATYEAAAAFARAHGICTGAIVTVREDALGGAFPTPDACFREMAAVDKTMRPDADALRPTAQDAAITARRGLARASALSAEQLALLGYRQT